MSETYEQLRDHVQKLQREGKLPLELTNAQRADWAYGNTKIENDSVTLKMAEAAVQDKHGD